MKKTIIIIAVIAMTTPFAAKAIKEYAKVEEIRTPSWVIDNGKSTLTEVYKIEDEETTCYIARSNKYDQSIAIDCVKENGGKE